MMDILGNAAGGGGGFAERLVERDCLELVRISRRVWFLLFT